MSGAVSADVEVRRDLTYAEPDGSPLQLDLYLPAGDGPWPVTLWLHGGGWAVGARDLRADERMAPLARAGIAVAAVQYRLTDRATFPAQLDDARAAVRWLRAHGAEHGLAPDRIGAWGASAGGHLAALLGLLPDGRDGELGDSSVQAVVSWFPPTDLLARDTDVPDGPPPPFLSGPPPSPSYEARLLGVPSTADDAEGARAASPLTHVHAGAPPFLLVHGDRDGLVPASHSRRLAEALQAVGAPVDLLLIAGANHEDPAFDSPASIGAVSGFLRAALS
jgi:acetyl esterase/lipase